MVDILNDMNLHELYPDIGTGWAPLLTKIEQVDVDLRELNSYQGIETIQRHNGMLRVVFNPTTSAAIITITNAVAYHIERLSAKMCEDCGQYGNRRIELTTTQTLCTRCYAFKYSELKDSQT